MTPRDFGFTHHGGHICIYIYPAILASIRRSQQSIPKTHCPIVIPHQPSTVPLLSTPTFDHLSLSSLSLSHRRRRRRIEKTKKYSNFVWVSSVCLCVDTNKQQTNKQQTNNHPKNTSQHHQTSKRRKNVLLLLHKTKRQQKQRLFLCGHFLFLSFSFILLLLSYIYPIYHVGSR